MKNESGSQSFLLTTKQCVEKTNAIGITATAGRYVGTYAHRDIAFVFATWTAQNLSFGL
ncbi:MAG: KilA-N domain-containing protein [Christensenellaceae bacterium]|nr:KilA-N domain-containing protein [Christensenellaceae bacterium]